MVQVHPGPPFYFSRVPGVVPKISSHFSRKIRDNLELLAALIRNANGTDVNNARSQAVLTYCALVGAIGMARAVSDKELSREILTTTAKRLKKPAP